MAGLEGMKMADTADPDVAAAMLHKTIVDNAEEFQTKQSVEEHLKLWQKCRMAVQWWEKNTISDIDIVLDMIEKRRESEKAKSRAA